MRPTAGRRCAVRPLRLDLAGFAVFREETTVDFTGADFFALVGPTGAGKSTVLDAICFALYGTVPRWVDRRSVANALAPSCPEARVRLIFESAGRRYAANRVVRRVGRAGTRVEAAHAGLERLPEGCAPASCTATRNNAARRSPRSSATCPMWTVRRWMPRPTGWRRSGGSARLWTAYSRNWRRRWQPRVRRGRRCSGWTPK